MNRTKIKNYAPQARRDFLQAVMDRAAFYGLTADRIEPVTAQGDLAIIGGRAFPREIGAKRKALQGRVERDGFGPTMEALAYTWFNRLVAIRYMELHGYLEHGYRVLSNPDPARSTPEILDQAEHVELPDLKRERVIELKLDGSKEAELYRMLLVAQCNALHSAMPFLFERIGDETELVLPESLLHSDSIVRKLVSGIDEEDWQEVEVIGWLYEAYVSERYEAVIGSVVASADIPAATQRFTPKWIVRYLVQNTLGRQWMATYPQSPLKGQMKYYIEPAVQTPEVQEQLRAITPTSLNPEEITFLDPACGSAHILVEAYDLFKAIYQERGYRAKDIPRLILGKNLFGLEIDDRAAQLAAFALMMKARADDRRILEGEVQPNVRALIQTFHELSDELREIVAPNQMLAEGFLLEQAYRLEDYKMAPLEDQLSVAVDVLIDNFEHCKTYGSIIQIYEPFRRLLPTIKHIVEKAVSEDNTLLRRIALRFIPILEQAEILANQYDCVVANPPYMGIKYYNSLLKGYTEDQYKKSKGDLATCFMERNSFFAKDNGFVGMITNPNWMFLSTFEKIRRLVLSKLTIDSFVHNGRGVFGSDFGSCSFVLRNFHSPDYRGTFRRLFDKQGSVSSNEELEQRFFLTKNFTPSSKDFAKVPEERIAYWISDQTRHLFSTCKIIRDFSEPQVGLQTSDNQRFIRRWSEVAFNRIGFGNTNSQDAARSMCRWFPLDKGGEFRRWYGNNEVVVNWENNGKEIKEYVAEQYPYLKGNTDYVVKDRGYFFQPGVTWNKISISSLSARASFSGSIFSDAGMKLICKTDEELFSFLGFLNSSVVASLLSVFSPTVNFEKGAIANLPFVGTDKISTKFAEECMKLSHYDWDTFESSWDFQSLPILRTKAATILDSQRVADHDCVARFHKMRELEEGNNRLFSEAYGLQNELSSEIPDDQITLYLPNREEDIKRLISYVVGCTMGRYSLDTPGLIYAHGGNVGFDSAKFRIFPADPDGIVPVMEADWFTDDAANRFAEFLGVAWPMEGLDENLKFVADALGPNKGEQPRDTIRRYLATGFYKHHLQTYKRRPIYWLFSSGKQRAFQCLVYLHRYHDGTLARMRTEYVIPLQGKLASRIDQLASDILKATSTSHRKTLTQERDKLIKQQGELQSYDEKLRHYADMRITLDLDDGVKVNYGKFGDLLAEVKAVTGGREED